MSFLIDARGASLDSGYVSSGYYGGEPGVFLSKMTLLRTAPGIAVGRVILIPVTNVLGHRRAVFV